MTDKHDQMKEVSILLDKAEKNKTSTKTVGAYALYMYSEWVKLAKPLIDEAGGKSTSTTSWVEPFIKKIDKKMGKFQSTIQEKQDEYVDYFYKYFKNDFIKSNDIEIVQKAEVPSVTPILWATTDDEALLGMKKFSSGASGSFYNNSVQQTVRSSIEANIIEGNLTLEEGVAQMKRDLTKALRIKPGSLESKVIPPGYKGTAEKYFSGLADHTATLSRTTGSVYTLDSIGATEMVIRSLNTNRTCVGCLEMDGTKYKVADAKKHANKIINADSISDLKDIQPWFHFKPPSEYDADGLKVAEASAKESVDGQMHIPPFHFRCECFVDMV